MKIILCITTITFLSSSLQAAVINGDIVGVTESDIRTNLTNSGYLVESIEFDDDEIEIEATLDGLVYEIELSSTTGSVIEIEQENTDVSDH